VGPGFSCACDRSGLNETKTCLDEYSLQRVHLSAASGWGYPATGPELSEESKLVNIPAVRTLVVLLCCRVNRLIVRLSSSQMRKVVSLSLTSLGKVSFLRVFFPFFVCLKDQCCFALLGRGRWTRKISETLGTSTQEILSLLRALIYEAPD